MAKVKLTDGKSGSIHKKAAAGQTLELYETVLPGFGLSVGQRASTYFIITRVRGQSAQFRRRVSDTSAMSLEMARAAARRVIEDAHAGIDPEQSRNRPNHPRKRPREKPSRQKHQQSCPCPRRVCQTSLRAVSAARNRNRSSNANSAPT